MEVKKDLIKRIKERILVNQSYYPYYIDVELNVLKEILEQVKKYYEEIYIVENMFNSYIKIK